MHPRAAHAFAELLPVLACGEESAALAFGALARRPRLRDAAGAVLARVAEEELAHEALLCGLRAALPPPSSIPEAMPAFYRGIGGRDPGRHLAGIAALDSAVCVILGAVLTPTGPVARERRARAALARIQADEAGHVRQTRAIAVALMPQPAAMAVAEHVRAGLVALLELRGAAFEALGVAPEPLFARLRRVPDSLFRA